MIVRSGEKSRNSADTAAITEAFLTRANCPTPLELRDGKADREQCAVQIVCCFRQSGKRTPFKVSLPARSLSARIDDRSIDSPSGSDRFCLAPDEGVAWVTAQSSEQLLEFVEFEGF